MNKSNFRVSICAGLFAFLFFGCANVSIRNYKPEALKENERTIVGTFEVFNEHTQKPMSECKITFLLPNGKDTRRYFLQTEDKGIVVTWSESGTLKLHAIDCGDSSFGVNFKDQNYAFAVDPKSSVTYFGHIKVSGVFSGMSDTSGSIALGMVGMAIAGATRTNELKGVTIEDRWDRTAPVFKELVPSLAKATVKKSLIKAK